VTVSVSQTIPTSLVIHCDFHSDCHPIPIHQRSIYRNTTTRHDTGTELGVSIEEDSCVLSSHNIIGEDYNVQRVIKAVGLKAATEETVRAKTAATFMAMLVPIELWTRV
jgi:hypothetical protein